MSIAHAELIPTCPTVADQLVEAGRDMAQSQHRGAAAVVCEGAGGDAGGAARDHERERSFRHRVEADGMVTLTIRLAPDDAAEALAAVEATVMRRSHEAKSPNEVAPATEGGDHASADASASLAQQRADAFVELVTDGGASVETEVVVHVRGDGCAYDDGATELLEYDHDPSFDETGHTIVEETRIRCAPCHRRRHERAKRGRGPSRD